MCVCASVCRYVYLQLITFFGGVTECPNGPVEQLSKSQILPDPQTSTAQHTEEVSNSLLQHVAARKPSAFSSEPTQLLKAENWEKRTHT